MKIAYLITAHNHPIHFKRLINAIASKNSVCFVHVDKKSKIEDFQGNFKQPVIFIKNRIPVYWAEFSIIPVMLMLIKESLNYSQKFERFVHLSGSDYPVAPVHRIENFFKAKPDQEFINIIKMPHPTKPFSRLTRKYPYRTHLEYKQNSKPSQNYFRLLLYAPKFVIKVMWRLSKKLLPFLETVSNALQRMYIKKYLGNLTPYAGSRPWALTREACLYIQEFVNKEQKITKFFETAHSADESFFHTILANSKFKSKIFNTVILSDYFPGWKERKWVVNKTTVDIIFNNDLTTKTDLYGFADVLFLRKFEDNSKDVIDYIDSLKELKFPKAK